MNPGEEGAGGLDVQPEPGWVSEEVADEFPALRLFSITLRARASRSPLWLKEQMRNMSSRFRGPQAVVMRQNPVPAAYRIFYRQVGMDPDADRTPIEAAAVNRLVVGAFKSENLLDDALVIGLMETGVPIWALDADKVDGPLGIRVAGPGEPMGRNPDALPAPPRRIVIADSESPLSVLFGDVAPGHGVTKKTTRMTLFSLQVAGVPPIHVEEALWSCVSVLRPEAE